MSANRLRALLIGVLLGAGIVSVVAQQADSAFLGWLSFALFAIGVAVYVRWRQAVRARVFDREAKTPDETSTRPDQ